ncbi:MAG: TIGR01777 family oxidoreductase [Pseudomonadota bacterium]
MQTLLMIFAVQGLLGAFDTIYHHELTERLPWRPTAAKELKLHGIRNFFYCIIFLSLAWFAWNGIFAWLFALMLLVEVVITLMDFVEEDRSRKLPATERITHTILALNYGVILALLAPILWQWSQQPTGFVAMNFGLLSWIMTLYAAGVLVWGCRDFLRGLSWSKKAESKTAATKKTKKLPLGIDALHKPNQHILVTGGTGFIGRPLCQAFIDQGHQVTILTRSMTTAAGLFHGRVTLVESLDLINDKDSVDIIINLAGESISQRWSTKAKINMRQSRTKTTEALIALIARLTHKPAVFISGSAIGIYGTDEEKSFTEETPPAHDFLGAYPRDICEEWEAAAKKAEKFLVRTCLLRTGVVLEMDGGALAQMLFPFDFGLGGPMGSGKQWFSWIHRDDLIRLIVHSINNNHLHGAINATAPEPVTNKLFSKALGHAMGRPALIPLPAFQVKLLFGKMGESLLLAGQKVLPQKAVASGFIFNFPTLELALEKIFMK